VGQFHILATGTLETAGLQAECRIVGASHVILYSVNGRPDLWEVFACQDVREAAPRYSLEEAIRQEVTTSSRGVHVFRASLVPIRDSAEHLKRLRLRPFCFEYQFPRGPSNVAPVTIISGEQQPGGMLIETIHSYPQHELVVVTSSQVQRRS
jgi:hypothetical protein